MYNLSINVNNLAAQYVELMDSDYTCESQYAEEFIRPLIKKGGSDVVPSGNGNYKLISL